MGYIELPKARKVLIAGHRNPDGDSLSCCVAISNLYKRRGSEARVWISGEVPTFIHWMVDLVAVETDPDAYAPDLLIIVDTPATSENVGLNLAKLQSEGARIIGIDHHNDKRSRKPIYLSRKNIHRLNQTLGDMDFVQMVQSYRISTASILIDYFGMTDPILYVGLRTDSGHFTRNTLECMRLATRLHITNEQIDAYHLKMKSGRKNPRVLEHIKRNGIQPIAGGRQEGLHVIGIEEESKEVAKELLGILKMFYANVGVVWKSGMSLRSENLDVSSIASLLGGGGHSRAAGSSNVSLDDMPRIVETIRSQLTERHAAPEIPCPERTEAHQSQP